LGDKGFDIGLTDIVTGGVGYGIGGPLLAIGGSVAKKFINKDFFRKTLILAAAEKSNKAVIKKV
jgi:hypothetical protein